jgi:hypothetical protein
VEGGHIKTFVLSTVIKINKELQTSMTHSPARLPQAFVVRMGQLRPFKNKVRPVSCPQNQFIVYNSKFLVAC